MNDLSEKLSALESQLKVENAKSQRTLKFTAGVYVVLIVGVLIYTTVLFSVIEEQVRPQALGEIAKGQVDQAAALPSELIAHYDANSDEWAKRIVDQTRGLIPPLRDKLKTGIEQEVQKAGKGISVKMVPAFTLFVRDHAKELASSYGEAKKNKQDLKIGVFLVKAFKDFLEAEGDKYIFADKLIDEGQKLQKNIFMLNRSEGQLTEKQLAERKIIISLIRISKIKGEDDSSFMQSLRDALDGKMQDLNKKEYEDPK